MRPADFIEARRRLEAKRRATGEKLVGAADAVGLVKDGDHVAVGGCLFSRTPIALVHEILRRHKRNLTLSRNLMCFEGELLMVAGAVEAIVTSWQGIGLPWGLSRVLRHYVESGQVRYEEWSHLGLGLRYRAGAMGVPFLPVRSMLGSDVLRQRPEPREIDCPFTGEKLLLVPALNPDVALIHVQRCDPYGNAQMDGLQFMDMDLAMAANRVILTTERIVSNDQIRRAPDHTKIPFFAVEAVVEVPFGCAPHECGGIYEPLYDHMDYYTSLVNKDPVGGMKEYLDRYVYGPKTWIDYLNLLGLAPLLDAVLRGRSIANA